MRPSCGKADPQRGENCCCSAAAAAAAAAAWAALGAGEAFETGDPGFDPFKGGDIGEDADEATIYGSLLVGVSQLLGVLTAPLIGSRVGMKKIFIGGQLLQCVLDGLHEN